MDSKQTSIPETVFDSKHLSALIIELNIAHRNFRSYPKEHPVINSSFNKVITCYNKLLDQYNEVSIGIARDSLVIGDEIMDKKNIVFKDFAKVLYEHGIGVITLQPGLKVHELINFNIILSLKREELLKHGGISAVWEKSRISSIAIKPVQYDLFSATEAASVSTSKQQQPQNGLWELFTRALIQGTLGGGTSHEELLADDDIDPEVLAKRLNKLMETSECEIPISFVDALSKVEQQLDQSSANHLTHQVNNYDKLAIFVNRLKPNLRRTFLSNCFDAKSFSGEAMAEEILSRFSDDNIIATNEDIKHNNLNSSSVFLRLIQKLSSHAAARKNELTRKIQNNTEINQRIKSIFCEHEAEDFTPVAYQAILERIVSSDSPSILTEVETIAITETLDGSLLENHLSEIILQLMKLGSDDEFNQILISNLSDTYYYLLQTGDYEQLIHLIEQCDAPEIPIAIRDSLRSNYTSRECLEEMLVGLTTWGKSRYDNINSLIKAIGEPFIDVLLDRLAEEENLSIRRFIMDRIQEFDVLARDHIIARLSDNRWFVLRNLIIILRTINDSTVVEHLRLLMHHTNNRVRQEALRTCLHFQDPGAERQILYDMGSNDKETQLAAIYLAEKSRSADVYKKLIAIISKPGFNNIECELKSAAIQALGEIGKVEALPELAKLLASKSLLNGRQLNKLKSEAVRSLRLYPTEIAKSVLLQLSSGSGDIAIQASETLKQMAEKAP